MNLVKEINEIIVDLNNQNYGIASTRLFNFLDVMDGVEKELAQACMCDPATTHRMTPVLSETGYIDHIDYTRIKGEEGWIHDVD